MPDILIALFAKLSAVGIMVMYGHKFTTGGVLQARITENQDNELVHTFELNC